MNTTPATPIIVLVTVNDYETHALLDAFIGEGAVPAQVTKGGVTYNDLGTHGSHRIVNTLCEMGAGGIGASQQRTREAIEHWQPRAIISVGIAFGLDETKQNIGDVLVSTQIQDYELGRLADGKLTPRGDKPSCADVLRNRLRQTDTTESRRGVDWPKVHFWLVLSGQKLVDNLDYRESLKTLFTEAIGGEMEGVGLYVSASTAKVDWIVVKGICDWGHQKNQADKDAWQKLAAKNAARVLKSALDVGSLYSSEHANTGDSHAKPTTVASGMNPSPISGLSARTTGPKALEIWQKKLAFLLAEEAKVSDSAQKFTLAEQIMEVKDKIAELEAATLSQQPSAAGTFRADISSIIKYAPTELIGREAETKLLSDAWDQAVRGEPKRLHLLTFVALGGEGKTSLVAKWAAELAHQDWPGCDAAFAWSFYSQGTRDQAAASSDIFLAEALTFFGERGGGGQRGGRVRQRSKTGPACRRAAGAADSRRPGAAAIRAHLAHAGRTQGRRPCPALLKGLAATSHGLCVVTTRYAIPDLRAFIGNTVREEKLTRLSTDAGVALLQSFGVKGSLRKTIPSADGRALWNEFEKLVEDVKGHALTLNLLGSYLRDAYAGDIRRRDLIKLEEVDAEEQGGHAFRVMDAYVKSFESGGKTAEDRAKGRRALALLQLLGLFDRPATADSLKALWQGEAIAGLTEPLLGLSEAQRNLSLQRLEDAKLLTVNREAGSGVLVRPRRAPTALRTPLRDHEGRRPGPPSKLSNRFTRPWPTAAPGGVAAGDVCQGLS